jgi:hypothetical protein
MKAHRVHEIAFSIVARGPMATHLHRTPPSPFQEV